MQIKLKNAQVHTVLFLAGRNLGDKLDITNRPNMELWYDRNTQELLIILDKHVSVVPSSNVASYTPVDPKDVFFKDEPVVFVPAGMLPVQLPFEPGAPVVKNGGRWPKKVSAQVSTPQDHVFAGPGKGKVD